MGALAEVFKGVVLVGGKDGIVVLFFQIADEFQLVGLVAEELLGFLRGQLSILKFVPLFEDVFHPLLNRLEIGVGESSRQIKIVVKSVFNGRTDSDLALREHL